MKKKSASTVTTENSFKVTGIVRDQSQQPLPGTIVRVYEKQLRRKQQLGESVTDSSGKYMIDYTLKNATATAIIVGIYDNKKKLLKESNVYHQPADSLEVNIDLSGKPLAGISEFEQLTKTISPFTHDIPLSQITENDKEKDISFISENTKLPRETIERLAMAERFETYSLIGAQLWYGMLQETLADFSLNGNFASLRSENFEARLDASFDKLMHTSAYLLVSRIQSAIDKNIVAHTTTKELSKIREQLDTQLLAYAKAHPVSGVPSELYQKAELGGLKGKELESFLAAHNNHTDQHENFWKQIKEHPELKNSNDLEKTEAVFHLSQITGNNLTILKKIVDSEKIKSKADIKKLIAYDCKDWESLLNEHNIKASVPVPAKGQAEETKKYATHLQNVFTKKFPTAAFTARLQKDVKSKLPHRDKVSKFLQENEHFDLLHTRIGRFMKENKHNVDEKDVPELEHHLRRTQRVFKLAPTYNAAHALLSNNIHSAYQVHKMGKDNFVRTYSDTLGEKEAEQVFENASEINATSTALLGNLKSMVDASPMNAFPDFSLAINQTLTSELPTLETLFGHTDFFATDESRSVYGAPAYLTDILHFLDKRLSTLPLTGTKIPSVKDLLLKRRPDIADIDLESKNTSTEVPYIDMACEIMEDYIAPPVITLANSFLASLVKGTISASLLTAIKAQLTATGQTNVSNLLSAAAFISDPYPVNHLQADNTYLAQTHWIIRDAQMALRASNTTSTGTVEFRVLHQTLISTEAISAGPEYINTNVYTNFLKTAKCPFTLPFDLFETEGELYLEKLGVKKARFIDTFRKEDKALPGASVTDLKIGYADLGINEAEQALIFVADPTRQSLYWGAAASATTIEIDIFEKLSGLNYAEIVNLIQLQFINPLKDTVIEHDDLSSDTTKQRLINLTVTKLDAIHRFLRLWRKTSLTMDELDAIIMAPLVGAGKILNKLALQLHQFCMLQQKLKLSAFQLLAFYQNIDATHGLPDCLYNQMFQNSAITNPVSVNFSIASATPGTLGIAEADKAVISAVLQVSINDVNALIAKTISRISFPALSGMYRYAQLAQSLDLSVTDLLKLVNLADVNPFQDLQSTCLFIQKYKLLQSSGFNIDELNYILRHQDDNNHSLVPSNGQVSTALTQLQNELLAIRTATQPAPDTNGALLTKWLSDNLFQWDMGLLNRLLDIINTTDNTDYQQKIDNNNNLLLNLRMVYHDAAITADLSALPLTTATPSAPILFPASISSQLSYDPDKKLLRLTGYMSPADKTVLLALSTDAGYQAAVNVLFNTAQQTDSSAANVFFATVADINVGLKSILDGKTADRLAFFINKLSPVYKKLQQQNALVRDISTWFKTDKKVVTQLLASVPGIYTDFTDDSFVNKVVALNNPAQFNRYQFVAKVCFIATRLKLTDVDLAFLLAHAVDINSLNFQALPLAPVVTMVTTFSTFEALINLLRFQQYYPGKIVDTANNTTLSIYTILTDAVSQGALTGAALTTYTANLVTSLSLLTGWNAADLISLIGLPTSGITLTLPADIKSVPILMRLHQRFVVLKQLGISAVDAFAWVMDSLLAADTAKIKQVLKQSYSNSDWLQVSKPLQDTLREKKRDALIAYLLANAGTKTWKEANDLYSYFLLDVEMCSCQPTSRIVEATNAVQLFVQRCFLQLEDSIVVDTKLDSTWLQWKWMKNFRVWQANVKVFLYPENYIEPELLPAEIKSPFLADLENDLLQGEVTATNVEDAFQTYLDKLNSTSRLEIKGTYFDEPSNNLHVFGRTYGGDPKVYYYRKFIQGRRWTPWVKVDLDISSEFIMPVVYNNHVYLFWAIIKQQADVATNWQIQLAYSEYRNGKWGPKKISENSDAGRIICDKASHPDITRFFFTPLDVPLADYADLFTFGTVLNPGPFPSDGFYQKIKKAILKNGTLIISCFYYDPTMPANINAHKYIESFKLDIAKGYPVKTHFPILFGFSSNLFSNQIVRNLQNMVFIEPTTPPDQGQLYNTPTPSQSRGRFNKLIPFQLGAVERMNYLQFLTESTNYFPAGFLLPYFYQDSNRTYYVRPEYTNNSDFELPYKDYVKYAAFDYLDAGGKYDQVITAKIIGQQTIGIQPATVRDRFFNFFNPRIGDFMQRLFLNGVDGLMDRGTQLIGDAIYDTTTNKFNFAGYLSNLDSSNAAIYSNESGSAYPIEDVDFSLQSGYGLYNWELFFHAPLMIAERLSQNHQFDDADRWYRYIFNPMDTSSNSAPNKFWNTKPFFENTDQDYLNQRIENVLKGINGGQQDLLQDVTDWRNNPFQPHYIAEYRTIAYQKVAVMKYIGHLIRYGDYLFSQHTMESVNQATQLYILAAEILGPKPEVVPSVDKTPVDNYYQLEQKLDAMSDALVNVENLLPLQTIKGYTGTLPSGPGLPTLQSLYFCTPMNENMAGPTGYWDMVADRLFKIRHCMNVDGTVASVSLFAPPIDPGLLVRAAAAGLDIGSILSDMNAPLPFYRFMLMIQKATELANEVKSLGALMLSILEKKDVEALALLRSGQEIKMQSAALLLKQKQIDDAQSMLDNLNKQRELVNVRQIYYLGLIREGLSGGEIAALALNGISTAIDIGIALSYLFAAGAASFPTIIGGGAGISSPVALVAEGGQNIASGADSLGRNLGAIAAGLDKAAALIGTNAGYDRRATEWQFQVDLASKELEQIQKQIEGAQIRLDIATQDLSNQQLMINQAKEADDFMRNKFTNEELFNWMTTQVSATYFRSYQLAYDIAKQTERCFRYELGLADSAYINFGYWDSLKKGLLAGELLSYDISKMQMAYYEQNKRELELTKPISLSQLDAVALLKLKTTGECWINLPEELFDMDYPGHYMRRIKSVSVTIPCITGPYTTISCKLTMTNNSVRTSGIASDATHYSRKLSNGIPADDPRFRDAVGALQSIATSSAQNDSGLFELNFRDERYLPFEGAGAISLWHLQLPAAIRQFDFNSISDVIIHLKYTARDGGESLRANAADSLATTINQMLVSTKDTGLMRIFSAKNDLPTEWYRFQQPVNTTDDQVLTLNLDSTRFPLFVQGKTIKIRSIELVADATMNPVNNIQLISPSLTPDILNLTATGIYGSLLSAVKDYSGAKKDPGNWTIKNAAANPRLTDSVLKNLVIIVHYEVS